MQRAAKNWSSGFPLKNGIPFTANFGYNMYDTNYNIATDNLMATGWNWKQPIFSAESSSFELAWWDIEGASTLAATGVALAAAVAALNI